MLMLIDVDQAVTQLLAKRREIPRQRSVLAAVTGIDASGKGYLSREILTRLLQQGTHAVHINVDGWLNLPQVRFNPENPAEHFYNHAIRFDELFSRLILPLKVSRSVTLTAEFAEETATEYRPHLYNFEDVSVIILEGIYLLKPEYRTHYDLTFWIDCSFSTALKRALARGQENLPPAETIQAYETIFFPAQRIHFARDNPRAHANYIINNEASSQ
jgi:uridine kinase